jgi:hypothetical protein
VTHPAPNGDAKRKLPSWIEAFIEQTTSLHSPLIFRKWVAIACLGAVMEQKVWLQTSSPIHPNLYVFIVGRAGSGKTRTIRVGRNYLSAIKDLHIAPVSVTWAALVDRLVEARRVIARPEGGLEYNSMAIVADELGAFMHKYDIEMTSGLSTMYDVDPYGHDRRGGNIKIRIKYPQLNILTGSTPQNLIDFIPENAWGQGFTSRMIMIFSDEKIIGDDFAIQPLVYSSELEHDLNVISNLFGQFNVTEDYQKAVFNWRTLGEPPVPNHPKLVNYLSRRYVNVYKLSMISSVDRDGALALTTTDFNRAMGWLIEAEAFMPDIFKAGVANADAQAMDEINHFVMVADLGKGVSEQRIVNFARERVPLQSILRVVEIMECSGMIHCIRRDPRTGMRYFASGARQEGTFGAVPVTTGGNGAGTA